MKIGTMLNDVFRSFLNKPVTQIYPVERTETPERLRGKVKWDAARCSGCQLCVKDCPSGALELITLDRANKRFLMLYRLDCCTYCAQCVHSCRSKCFEMDSEDWELAALDRLSFAQYYGKEADVDVYLEQVGHPDAEKPGID